MCGWNAHPSEQKSAQEDAGGSLVVILRTPDSKGALRQLVLITGGGCGAWLNNKWTGPGSVELCVYTVHCTIEIL